MWLELEHSNLSNSLSNKPFIYVRFFLGFLEIFAKFWNYFPKIFVKFWLYFPTVFFAVFFADFRRLLQNFDIIFQKVKSTDYIVVYLNHWNSLPNKRKPLFFSSLSQIHFRKLSTTFEFFRWLNDTIRRFLKWNAAQRATSSNSCRVLWR